MAIIISDTEPRVQYTAAAARHRELAARREVAARRRRPAASR